jgi:hypothetical protein
MRRPPRASTAVQEHEGRGPSEGVSRVVSYWASRLMSTTDPPAVNRSDTMPLVRLRTVTVVDPDTAIRWSVSEIVAFALPAAPRATCLVFSADGVARRIWNYPPNWADLHARELIKLSWQT